MQFNEEVYKTLCVQFSGGKDSTAMLIRLLEEKRHVDKVVRVDFGVDYKELYTHISQVEKYCKELQPDIEFKTIDARQRWYDVLSDMGYPSAMIRWCQRDKTMFCNRETKNSTVAMGFAYDEKSRMFVSTSKSRRFIYPLIGWEMTEKDCLYFCNERGFDFGGLYDIRDRVSCYCCPFISNKEIVNMPQEYIDKIHEFEEIGRKSGYSGKMFLTESFDEKRERLIKSGKVN